MGYLVLGGLMTATLALLPFFFHLAQRLNTATLSSLSLGQLGELVWGRRDALVYVFFLITIVLRFCLIGLFFFMMCVAERTYKQVMRFKAIEPDCSIAPSRISSFRPPRCHRAGFASSA